MSAAMDPCPYDKRGRHELMAFFSGEGDTTIPITLICSMCGTSRQYPMDWAAGESLDDKTAQEIKAAVDGHS